MPIDHPTPQTRNNGSPARRLGSLQQIVEAPSGVTPISLKPSTHQHRNTSRFTNTYICHPLIFSHIKLRIPLKEFSPMNTCIEEKGLRMQPLFFEVYFF